MNRQMVPLIDSAGRAVASAVVADEGEYFAGSVDVSAMPADVRSLFDEFEQAVDGQMLSLVDEIERRIADLQIRAVFPDGFEAPVRDLQIFPTAGSVTFAVAESPAATIRTSRTKR